MPANNVVKEIRRATRRKFSAEEKIRIVLEGLRGAVPITEQCRREGIAVTLYFEIMRPREERKITALAPPLPPGPVKIIVRLDPDDRYQEVDETSSALQLELEARP